MTTMMMMMMMMVMMVTINDNDDDGDFPFLILYPFQASSDNRTHHVGGFLDCHFYQC